MKGFVLRLKTLYCISDWIEVMFQQIDIFLDMEEEEEEEEHPLLLPSENWLLLHQSMVDQTVRDLCAYKCR